MKMEREFFAALLDPERPPPAGLTAWNGSDPAKRFAVYRNNVVVSLIDALADTYPVIQELVGEAFFRAMARVYVRDSPPRSRVLAFYGESLPEFIEAFPPAASVPYLADVARLEMLRVRAYHAADRSALPADAIARFLDDSDTLPMLRVSLSPSLFLLRSRYAVATLWAAHQGLVDLAGVDPDVAENALVVRSGLQVDVMRVDDGDSVFVEQLMRGACLGAALETANETTPGFDPGNILTLLIRVQAISSMRT